jgi:hypothetical protein
VDNEPVHPVYNPSFSARFFSRNSIFLSQQISQQCFSAGLSAQPNGANVGLIRLFYNPYFSACFFSRNSIFLSQQISEQYFQPYLFSEVKRIEPIAMHFIAIGRRYCKHF